MQVILYKLLVLFYLKGSESNLNDHLFFEKEQNYEFLACTFITVPPGRYCYKMDQKAEQYMQWQINFSTVIYLYQLIYMELRLYILVCLA